MVRETTVDAGCGVVPRALSPMQQGMLFHSIDRRSPGVDIEQVVCEIAHPISAPEFVHAWQLMVRRHETLRTSFLFVGGEEPRQIVLPPDDVTLSVRVLGFANAVDAQTVLEQYLASDRRLGFATLSAPLARVALLMVSDGHSWCVLTYHHLVLDARAMFTLFKEVFDAHDALAVGRNPELPPVRPYHDYLRWLGSLDAHRAEVFWRDQFQGLATPTLLRLPSPVERPNAEPDVPAELVTRFTELQTAWLRDAARCHGVTLNTLLQGAWALVLSRFTGEDDLIFGAVRACRRVPVEGADAMVGMLINTVPVRVRISSAAPARHWLRDLREQWVAIRDYEHTPLLQVQRWSGLPQGRPLFETLFNYQEPSWIAVLRRLGGLWTQRCFEIRSQPNYPLALDIYGDEALLVRAFYDSRRFAADVIARMLDHFRSTISALADAHVDTLGSIPRLPPDERKKVLATFNGGAVEFPRHLCVHTAVEAHAAVAPGNLAVDDGKTRITYGELDERASRLAARLRREGVGPDVVVAVCMRRSTEMFVAWLAALKAGGAYLPLDPEYPPERLAFCIRDSGAPVLLSQPGLAIATALPASVVRINIQPGGGGFEAEASTAIECDVTARNLAYVIYTSGSTGQPKGVEIEHRSLMNLVSWHRHTYGITEQDRATQLASPAFDASVWETWPYLASGASIHVPDEEARLSPGALVRWLSAQQITVCFVPTPLAEAALAESWPESITLRALLTGGDRLRRAAPGHLSFKLYNHYGPTESTVVTTACPVEHSGDSLPPIGRPIANISTYVLDRELRPVPIGVSGELFVGGEGLARGYRNQPDLTARRFIDLTFETSELKPAPKVRVYRTGDLVRWRPDGQLEFLGRVDQQVKIRGCRVEPAEVSAALQRHPQVREAVAVSRDDGHGHAQLVAYVVPASGAAPGGQEIRDFVRELLPSYMIPSSVVVLDEWPLTPNGKVDLGALPDPRTTQQASAAVAPPRSVEEHAIATAWAGVLGRERIGLDDNFFDLGGHSLLAAQAVSRINAVLGVSVSVRLLFDHPTVTEFARALAGSGADSAPRHPALRPKRRASVQELEPARNG